LAIRREYSTKRQNGLKKERFCGEGLEMVQGIITRSLAIKNVDKSQHFGTNPFELQIALGHSTLEMTRRYTQALGFEDVFKRYILVSPVDMLVK
jgi:hypothetical protein